MDKIICPKCKEVIAVSGDVFRVQCKCGALLLVGFNDIYKMPVYLYDWAEGN